MFTSVARSLRHQVGAVAAVVVVSMGAAVFNVGHALGAPRGSVEVGPVELVSIPALASVMTLPEIVVTAPRELSPAQLAGDITLPEVVVLARRPALVLAGALTAPVLGKRSATVVR